jgi:hypothetical protein
MKKSILTALLVAGVAAFLSFTASGADKKKEVTITGDGKCAKCALKEKDECQNAVEVKEDGKKVTYYLTGEKSKAFHKNVCKETKKVTATGTVTEKDGKKELEVSKIELVKE